MGITQVFTGLPVPLMALSEVFDLISASPFNRFKLELVLLNRVTFYQKPANNTTTTTKGYKIYLSSDFFTLPQFRQAEILVHEAVHVRDQIDTGLYFWLAKYLINPWFRLEAELAALVNEIRWEFVWRKLPPTRFQLYADGVANGFKATYLFGPFISASYISQRITNMLNREYAFYQTLHTP